MYLFWFLGTIPVLCAYLMEAVLEFSKDIVKETRDLIDQVDSIPEARK